MVDELSRVRLSREVECYTAPDPMGLNLELKFIHVEVFETDTYLNDVVAIPENGVVLDLGANVGLFTLLVKSLKKAATILAFEPMPPTFKALRKNIELHGLNGVTPYSTALGSADESDVEFTYYSFAPGNSTRYPKEKGSAIDQNATRYKVPVTTVSSVLSKHPEISKIDLVKIDIEGGEAGVLRGLTSSDWSRIGSFVVEVDNRMSEQVDHVKEIFEYRNYEVTVNPHPMIPEGGNLYMLHATKK